MFPSQKLIKQGEEVCEDCSKYISLPMAHFVHTTASLSCFSLPLGSLLLLFMVLFYFGSLNIHGQKWARLFEFLRQEWADVVLFQEMHSDLDNQGHWLEEWERIASLSHGSNVMAVVAVLFP